jgi:hypothetical protein
MREMTRQYRQPGMMPHFFATAVSEDQGEFIASALSRAISMASDGVIEICV